MVKGLKWCTFFLVRIDFTDLNNITLLYVGWLPKDFASRKGRIVMSPRLLSLIIPGSNIDYCSLFGTCRT